MAVRTLFEAKNWSHQIQHGTVWGNREIRLTGVYSVPPSLEIGNHVLKGKLRIWLKSVIFSPIYGIGMSPWIPPPPWTTTLIMETYEPVTWRIVGIQRLQVPGWYIYLLTTNYYTALLNAVKHSVHLHGPSQLLVVNYFLIIQRCYAYNVVQ